MHRIRLILFLFSISSCIHVALFAQSVNSASNNYPLKSHSAGDSLNQRQIKIDFLRVDDGLSQGNIQAIAQDKNGFMWFGAQDGLNKYDGLLPEGFSIKHHLHTALIIFF